MKRTAVGLLTGVLLITSVIPAHAALLNDDQMSSMTWTKVWQDPLVTATGNVQGMCSTDDYIIMIENVEDNSSVNDVVTAYYRNDHDENGNPVERYSIAKRVSDREWEHGNGMAYNPKTDEIYVSLYTNLIPENRRALYVMDPHTLEYKRTITVQDTEDYNVLGISYLEDSDEYMIQTNVDAGYSFKRLNSDFEVIENMGGADILPGVNTQDMCVVENYIINSPCGGGDYANVYSISDNRKVASVPVNLDEPDLASFEIESFTQLEPGHVLLAARKTSQDGSKYACFYETQLPVETVAEKEQRLAAEGLTATMSMFLAKMNDSGTLYEKQLASAAVTTAAFNVQKNLGMNQTFYELTSSNVLVPTVLIFLAISGTGLAVYSVHVQMERKRRRLVRLRRRADAEAQLRMFYEELEAYA